MFRVAGVFLFFGLFSVAAANNHSCALELIHFEQINRDLPPGSSLQLQVFGIQDSELREEGARILNRREDRFEVINTREGKTITLKYHPLPQDKAKLTRDGKVLIRSFHEIVLCEPDGDCRTIIKIKSDRITAAEYLDGERVLVGTQNGQIRLVSAEKHLEFVSRFEEILSFTPIAEGTRILVMCKTNLYVLDLNRKHISEPFVHRLRSGHFSSTPH